MAEDLFKDFRSGLTGLRAVHSVGRVCDVIGSAVHVTGLGRSAAIGDRVRLVTRAGAAQDGEVIRVGTDRVVILAGGGAVGVALGDRVALLEDGRIAPSDTWIGRVLDPYGRPMDGRPLLPGGVPRALRAPPPPAATRRGFGARLATGYNVLDTLLPLVRGQRIGLFAGSGVGKSRLIAGLARQVPADVTVLALVGERGRELRDFVEDVLGPQGMARSVVIAATSDRSPFERRRCLLTALSVAEHFRDAGRHVLFLADSVTRFAEAYREVACAAGEVPALRGYPPSVTHEIMAACERAGPGAAGQGDITAVFSVLVAGSDMEEPIADILRGVLDGHVVLDRGIAESGRFPAVDLLRSVSRALPGAASEAENRLMARTRALLAAHARSENMLRAGLYRPGSDPEIDAAVRAVPELTRFFSDVHGGDPAQALQRLGLLLRRCGVTIDPATGPVPPQGRASAA